MSRQNVSHGKRFLPAQEWRSKDFGISRTPAKDRASDESFRKYFSSARHAQILWCMLIWSLVWASTTFAQLTIDTSLSNSVIAIQKIFLSASGLATGSNSTIELDGVSGNTRFSGSVTLTHASYAACGYPGGCILAINPNGVVVMTGAVTGSAATTSSGTSYWTKNTNTPTNTGAYDINFWDPALVSGTIPGSASLKQDNLRIRIGVSSGWSLAGWPQLLVAKPIETRESLVINYPLNGSNTQQLNAGSAGGTRSELTTNTTDGDKALTIKSKYISGSSAESYIHFKSGTGAVPNTNVGINTPASEYPTRALDNNGETLMRDNLNVGYNTTISPVTTIRTQVGIAIPTSQNPANYADKACNAPEIPAAVACAPGTCWWATSRVGIDVGTFVCYDNNAGSSKIYLISTLINTNKNTFTVDTGTQRVGINTLAPQYTLDVIGNSTFGGETSIKWLIINSTGMTSVKLAEVDSKETTPYNLPNMCCKVLSVDANSNITLVNLPSAVCTPAPSCPIAPETYQYTGSRSPWNVTKRCGCDTNIHAYDTACDSTGATYLGNVGANMNMTCYDISADTNTKKEHIIQMINYVGGWNSTLQHQPGTNIVSSLYTGAPKCTCDSSDGGDCWYTSFSSSDVWANCIDREGIPVGSHIPWGLNGHFGANNFSRL
jgi:hypothetical protein